LHVRETVVVRRGFRWGDRTERVHLEDLGVGGRITLKWIPKKLRWGMDWIELAQIRTGGGSL